MAPALLPKDFKEFLRLLGAHSVEYLIATSISGVTFEDCYRARLLTQLDDVAVNLIDLEHLKINKRAAGRHKDLDDLENLP